MYGLLVDMPRGAYWVHASRFLLAVVALTCIGYAFRDRPALISHPHPKPAHTLCLILESTLTPFLTLAPPPPP